MPVFYENVLEEHRCVRNAVGLFDVSHMGEIRVVGPRAAEFLNRIAINDVNLLEANQGQYTAMCNDAGGVIDDLILYRLAQDEFFLCVNASNVEKDFNWIASKSASYSGLQVLNESTGWAQLAIQGPNSEMCLKSLMNASDALRLEILAYTHIMALEIFGEACLIARTGYTGEKGYELYLPPKLAPKIWMELLEKGQRFGIKPIGLGARDTLRLEACYLLYGNDMDDTISPLEAGIGWAVKYSHDFNGKAILEAQKAAGLKRRLHGFTMMEGGIPRHGMDVIQMGKKIGIVTSGSVLPTVGGAGGLALLSVEDFNPLQTLSIDIRGSEKRAKVTPIPLYKPRVKTLN